MTSSKWKHFPRYLPFLQGIHRWIPRTKANDASFDVFFDLRPNKWLSKQSWGRWFETQSRALWRHMAIWPYPIVADLSRDYVISPWCNPHCIRNVYCIAFRCNCIKGASGCSITVVTLNKLLAKLMKCRYCCQAIAYFVWKLLHLVMNLLWISSCIRLRRADLSISIKICATATIQQSILGRISLTVM